MSTKNYFDIEIDEAREENFISHLSNIVGVGSEIFDSIPDNKVLAYAKIEMASFPTEISISSGMTRQKQQYCPNNYHVSMKIDVSLAKEIIIQEVAAAPKGEKLLVYKDLKSYLYKSIFSRYDNHEAMLRKNMAYRAKEDGTALPGDV